MNIGVRIYFVYYIYIWWSNLYARFIYAMDVVRSNISKTFSLKTYNIHVTAENGVLSFIGVQSPTDGPFMARHSAPYRGVVHGASRHEYVIQGQDANSFVYYSITRSARVGFNFMAGGHGAPGDDHAPLVWRSFLRYYSDYFRK